MAIFDIDGDVVLLTIKENLDPLLDAVIFLRDVALQHI